ncbi:MAG: FliI/YscN family ATPase [Phycisphaeraceae bacterium]|nr:MAG: FliI/YscN family ATPase [Phycisphaeraceae bacterium]
MRLEGTIASLKGLTQLVDDLPAPVGTLVTVRCADGSRRTGEIVGFDGARAIVMTLGQTSGVRTGDSVVAERTAPTTPVGHRMLGRVLNGMGEPIDDRGPIHETIAAPLMPAPLSAMKRRRITQPLPTGVRCIDMMTTIGRGQRIGVFSGPGVGKSTLLGSIARNTEAEVNVIALVGERGREVRDFIEESLGPEGLARSVVVVATSDESPLLRIRAVMAACTIAEHFRDQGRDVMLLMDSVTRFAQAQRQVGLAVGEPPATKGYTPSVFALLPLLLERAGAVEGSGSITGIYTILVEGDDLTEPISDACRGVLDGHIVLTRELARRGHFPAIDALDSISRVAGDICDAQHITARSMLLQLLSAHREVEDLLDIGAYAHGSNPQADVAIALKPRIDELLRQAPHEREAYEESKRKLLTLAVEAGSMIQGATQRRPGAVTDRRA